MFRKNIRLAPAIPDWTKLERLKADERGEAPFPGMFEQLSQAEVEQGLKVAQIFAETLCSRLSSQLALTVIPQSLHVAKMSSPEFLQRYTNGFLVYADLAYPELGSIFCLWDYPLAQALLNRLAGGPGQAQVENEELTEIEKNFFGTLLQEAEQCFSSAWRGALPSSPQKTAIYAPRLSKEHSFSEKEDMIVLGSGIALPGQEGDLISWVLPETKYAALVRSWAVLARTGKKRIRLSPDAVSVVDVPVKAHLGKAIISLKDVLRLQRGDIILLDKPINEPVSVWVGQEAQFLAQAGSLRERLAVQLLAPASKRSRTAEPLTGAEQPEAEQALEAPIRKIQRTKEVDLQGEDSEEEEKEKEEPKADEDDILDNIEDVDDDEEDEEFVWDEEQDKDEDF